MTCVVLHVAFRTKVTITTAALEAILNASRPYLDSMDARLYVMTLADTELGLRDRHCQLQVDHKDEPGRVFGLAEAIEGGIFESCRRVNMSARPKLTSEPKHTLFMVDIGEEWIPPFGGMRPAYCTIYIGSDLSMNVRVRQQAAMAFVSALESLGEILCGTISPDDEKACRFGDAYIDTGEPDVSVDRALEWSMWAADVGEGRPRLRKPAWAMVLGRSLQSRVPMNNLKLAMALGEASRKPEWREWLASTNGGNVVVGVGRDPLLYAADIFGDEYEAARRICNVLRRAGVLL